MGNRSGFYSETLSPLPPSTGEHSLPTQIGKLEERLDFIYKLGIVDPIAYVAKDPFSSLILPVSTILATCHKFLAPPSVSFHVLLGLMSTF